MVASAWLFIDVCVGEAGVISGIEARDRNAPQAEK